VKEDGSRNGERVVAFWCWVGVVSSEGCIGGGR